MIHKMFRLSEETRRKMMIQRVIKAENDAIGNKEITHQAIGFSPAFLPLRDEYTKNLWLNGPADIKKMVTIAKKRLERKDKELQRHNELKPSERFNPTYSKMDI